MLSIPKEFYDAMIGQAQAEHPNECCGLLAGKNGRVTQIYRMTNTQRSPVNYLMDPREQFVAFKEMRKNGLELLVIYHSHPHTEAYPSKTDIRLAYYPDAIYIILSLQDKKNPVVNAYRIANSNGEGKITQEKFEII